MDDEYGEGMFLPTSDCLKGIFAAIKFGVLLAASVYVDVWFLTAAINNNVFSGNDSHIMIGLGISL